MKKVKAYKCTDCKEISYLEDNGEIRVGFCKKCGHPLWNPAEQSVIIPKINEKSYERGNRKNINE